MKIKELETMYQKVLDNHPKVIKKYKESRLRFIELRGMFYREVLIAVKK